MVLHWQYIYANTNACPCSQPTCVSLCTLHQRLLCLKVNTSYKRSPTVDREVKVSLDHA